MTDDMAIYGDSHRPVLPTWPYIVVFAMIAVAGLLFKLGNDRLQNLGLALFLTSTVLCWGIGFYWLREKFRRSAQWERRPVRFWLSIAPVIILMTAWPTLFLAALLTDLQKSAV